MNMKLFNQILFLILLTTVLPAAETRQVVLTFINNPLNPELAAQQIKSGTRYVLLTRQLWPQLSGQEQQLYLRRASLQPVRQRTGVSPSGRFTLHWDESGINAVPLPDLGANGIPDYIGSGNLRLIHSDSRRPPATMAIRSRLIISISATCLTMA
jgi:hypothetical protein